MEETTKRCIEWIKNFFETTGKSRAVVGVSGGKDSAVCAALCTQALGPYNVDLVYLPEKKNGTYSDDADYLMISKLVETTFVGFEGYRLKEPYVFALEPMLNACKAVSAESAAFNNFKARLRMALLYGIAQDDGDSLVCNTSNLDEKLMGYSTLWGDSAGDFSPLGLMHVSEVVAIGKDLGLPKEVVERAPADGLCGKTDEEALGFSYADVEYVFETLCQSSMCLVRSGCSPLSIALPEQVSLHDTANSDIRQRIKRVLDRYSANKFKYSMINMPTFAPTW